MSTASPFAAILWLRASETSESASSRKTTRRRIFHVVTPDGDVMVGIADLQVHEGSIDRKSLRTAIEWASQNIALLEAEWSRLND